MPRAFSTLATALVLAFAAAACATAPPASDRDRPTRIQVENFNSMTVTVEAVSSGREVRLGQVSTGDVEVFTLPGTLNRQDLRVLVDPIGGAETWISRELILSDGDVVEVSVEPNLNLTSASIF